jgi:threonyl-tRNA synthetase
LTVQETTVSAIPPIAPDIVTVKVAAGTSAADALAAAGVSANDAVVVRDLASGRLRDLAWVPDADVEVEPVSPRSPDGLAVLRHSTAHVLAQAVQALYPGTLLGIGPPIENGFYYDFLPSRPFTPEDFAVIEKKMAEIIKAGQRFVRRPIADDEARIDRSQGICAPRRGCSGSRQQWPDHVRQRRRSDR